MNKQIVSLLTAATKNFDDKQAEWVKSGITRALCDNFDWNLGAKQQKMAELHAEIKFSLDTTRSPHDEAEEALAKGKTSPVAEITDMQLTRKIDFYDNLEAQANEYQALLDTAKAVHLDVTGKPWTKRKTQATPAARKISDLRKRFA